MTFGEIRSNCLPYGIRKIQGKEDYYEFFQRDYGALTNPVKIKLTRKDIEKLSWRPDDVCNTKDMHEIWFYNDGSIPTLNAKHWKTYEQKLKYIMQLSAQYTLGKYTYYEDSKEEDWGSDQVFSNGLGSLLLPYGLRQIEDGLFELFNRHYKAIGTPFGIPSGDPRKLKNILVNAQPEFTKLKDLKIVFFYNGDTKPTSRNRIIHDKWDIYMEKLNKLAKISTCHERGAYSFS